MKIKIENMMGISTFEVETDKPLLVFGGNEAGKSSVAVAVGAAVSRMENPLGVRTTTAYVRDGASGGQCKVETDKGSTTWRPGTKACFIDVEEAPTAHPLATGCISMLDVKTPEDRAKFWEQCFMPKLPVDKFRADIMPWLLGNQDEADEIHNRMFEKLLNIIDKSGWETAENIYQEHARAYKRQWQEALAGIGEHVKYGRKKAADLLLPGWSEGLNELTAEDAQRRINKAQEVADNANVADAVDDALRLECTKSKEKLPELRERLAQVKEAIGSMEKKMKPLFDRIKNTGKELQAIKDEGHLICPGCEADLSLLKGKLVEYKPLPEAELSKMKEQSMMDVDELKGLDLTEKKLQVNKAELDREIYACKTQAARIEGKHSRTVDDKDRFAQAERDMNSAKKDLLLVTVKQEADKAHAGVMRCEGVVNRLKASGFRANLIKGKRDTVVNQVNSVFRSAGWGTVSINESDLSIDYNGRPLALWSGSTKWRVNAVFQAAIAVLTKSRVVIFDQMDILDKHVLEGFMSWIVKKLSVYPLQIICCMTAISEIDLPSTDGFKSVRID